jgi:hypothetical protein
VIEKRSSDPLSLSTQPAFRNAAKAAMDLVIATSFVDFESVVITSFLDARTLDDSSPRGAAIFATRHARSAHSLCRKAVGAFAT